MIGVGDAHGIVSLYGENYADLTPTAEHLEGLDIILVDLQDVGARYYTFVWTMVLARSRACSKAGVKVVILDRPNPIGHSFEGRLQADGFLSFVGAREEFRFATASRWVKSSPGGAESRVGGVQVVSHEGKSADPPWVLPSPNMPTRDTALVYPGGCLLEGTNLSDGRGTTRPFEITGAPWIDGNRLSKQLRKLKLPGFFPRPLSFEPTFHKHAKQSCGGVQIHVTNPAGVPARRHVRRADRALPSRQSGEVPVPHREIRVRRRQTGIRYFDRLGDGPGTHFER